MFNKKQWAYPLPKLLLYLCLAMENSTPGKERISILGCGWYGLALAKTLVDLGYTVKGSTTSPAKIDLLSEAGIEPYLVDFGAVDTSDHGDFFQSDILFISIPPKRNLPQPDDYLQKISMAGEAAAKATVKQVIFISSTGVYQDGNFTVDETIAPKPESPSGKALLGAEKLLKENKAFGTTIIRFGGLFGPNRTLAKHFAGRVDIPNGKAPINLIHLDDCIQISLELVRQKAFGHIYHAVSPFHPTRAEFYTQACLLNGLDEPQFLAEKLEWKQIESVNLPAQLNYAFKVANWEQWKAKMVDGE